jgi:hypothetical protein
MDSDLSPGQWYYHWDSGTFVMAMTSIDVKIHHVYGFILLTEKKFKPFLQLYYSSVAVPVTSTAMFLRKLRSREHDSRYIVYSSVAVPHSDVKSAMFLRKLGNSERDLQIYSIAQWLYPIVTSNPPCFLRRLGSRKHDSS